MKVNDINVRKFIYSYFLFDWMELFMLEDRCMVEGIGNGLSYVVNFLYLFDNLLFVIF